MRCAIPLLFVMAFAGPVSGQAALGIPEAEAAFSAGEYGAAATLARPAGTADALAFAARAVLAGAMCGQSAPEAARLAEAETLALAALDLDPHHIEARLQLAIAWSLQVRPMSRREAMRSGLGEDARDLAESVLADDPDNPYAHAMLAVWHIEVVRRGGSVGSAIMGASVRDGLAHYAAAAQAAPDDASIHWQVGRALTALNVRRYRDEIDTALARAVAAECEDALERLMAQRAAHLADLVSTQDRRDVERLAADML